MTLKFYTPHPLLQPLVSNLMIFAESFHPDTHLSTIPYPPIAEQSLFFYPRSPIRALIHGTDKSVLNPHSILVGPQLKRVDITLGHDHMVIRVGFRPGGLHRLLGMPLHEMVDEAASTADFFNREIRQVNEQLFNTIGTDEMIRVIEKFLLGKLAVLRPLLPFDQAMLALVKNKGALSVEELASMACLSTRQFERQSKDRVGLPPKLFARLVRFSNAFRLFERSASLTWTHIAHASGYYDQMHFIRDCKEFAGVTPKVIAREVADAPARLQYMLQI